MKRTGHKSVIAARTELANAGYHLAHTPPDATGEKWQKLPPRNSRKAMPAFAIKRIERPRSTVWEIVNYP
jgi:hypothetical protein